MSPTYVSVAEAFRAQPSEIASITKRLDEQTAEYARFLESRDTHDVVKIVGIGASLAAASLAVHDLNERGTGALRVDASRALQVVSAVHGPDVFVSASGRSAELEPVMRASRHSMLVTGNPNGPLAALADVVIDIGYSVDSELAIISFTGTLLALDRLARWAAPGKGAAASAEEGIAPSVSATGAGPQAFAAARSVDIVATDRLLGLAEEAALLFREGVRQPATALSGRQYLHGPIEASDKTAVLLLGPALPEGAVAELEAHGVPVATLDVAESSAAAASASVQAFFLRIAEEMSIAPGDFLFSEHGTKLTSEAPGSESA